MLNNPQNKLNQQVQAQRQTVSNRSQMPQAQPIPKQSTPNSVPSSDVPKARFDNAGDTIETPDSAASGFKQALKDKLANTVKDRFSESTNTQQPQRKNAPTGLPSSQNIPNTPTPQPPRPKMPQMPKLPRTGFKR